jgi:DNA-directed RNA polymerase specialized sigma24 family protein
MTPDDRARLDQLMAAMAIGDAAAVFAFIEHFGADLARLVRATLRSWGRIDLLRSPDEVDFLVQSAAFEIHDRAAAWNPDGAPPGVWGAHAIRAAIARDVGHPTVDLDDHRDRPQPRTPPAPAFGPTGDVDLDALAHRHAGFRTLRHTLATVASDRDRHVVEQFLVQQTSADPSPSHTVATDTGLSSTNVRQIVSRTRRRARRHLQAAGDTSGVLGPHGWLAPS